MTQVYGDDNSLVPVTVIEVGPCPVVQVKSVETDGYNAIQIGFGSKKPKNTSNALKKHFAKASVEPCATLKEVRIDEDSASYNAGDVITAEVFVGTAKVDIIGIT
ncbi:50S ribosomal protein L3, partial [Arthrospira platensis SPKY1]|nr:50S ribosomal protein L3 [Arthrospira platensis SPKY1]